mmetsp:Transcript_22762/g.21969  ORF Transcript_22762/g.21969 Transcript_22762/m.21969 type:complete len:93 (+) Transcript_22762:1534-1812(+)
MNQYDEKQIQEIINPKNSYILLTGESLSGKTTVAQAIEKNIAGFKHMEHKALEDAVKKSKGTEEEPFEGEIQPHETYAELLKRIQEDKSQGN